MTRRDWVQLAAFAFVVVVGAYGFQVQQDQTDQIRELNRKDEIEDEVDDAHRCIDEWINVGDKREAIELAATAGSEALITVAPNADPERIAAYRAAIQVQADAARDQFPDPECDRVRAQRVLDDPAFADALATDDNQ